MHPTPGIMVYMSSENTATESSTHNGRRAEHGRRKERPDSAQTFTPEAPLGWGTQLNYSALTLTAAVFVAPQILLYPAALAALPLAAFFTSGVAARNLNRRANTARLRTWARKHHGLQLSSKEARDLLVGGTTGTHQATLHGTHLHLAPVREPVVAQEVPAIPGIPGNPVPAIG